LGTKADLMLFLDEKSRVFKQMRSRIYATASTWPSANSSLEFKQQVISKWWFD
jgi:hypothetical protein